MFIFFKVALCVFSPFHTLDILGGHMSFHIVSSSVLPNNVFASTIDALILDQWMDGIRTLQTWLWYVLSPSLRIHQFLNHIMEKASIPTPWSPKLSTLSYVTWLGHSSLKVHSLCHSFELALPFSEVSPLGFVTHWVPCVLLSTSFIDTGESRFTGEYWTPWERGTLVSTQQWVPGALFLHL